MDALLARLASAVGHHRRLTFIVWIVLVVLSLPFAGTLSEKLSSGGFEVPGSASVQVNALFDRSGRGAQPFTFVVRAPDAAATQARIAAVASQLGTQFPQITFPQGPTGSPDGTAMVITGYAPVTQDGALDLAAELQ